MKKLKKISLLLMAVVLTGCSAGAAVDVNVGDGEQTTQGSDDNSVNDLAYESLFEKDQVTKVEITIEEENWQAILDNPEEKEYYSADIVVGDVEVENVGFRAKGNSSLNNIMRTDSERYSFKIKLDKFVDDQTLLGLDKFVLNNMYADPSYMREYLHYEALELIGDTTPLNAFASVYINDEFYGLYLMVEAIDESFIERNFENTDGNLYNQDTGSYLQLDENGEYPRSDQKTGENESKEDLHALVKTLDDMPLGEKGNIEEVLDVDSALRNFAANVVFGNFDSYNSSMGNNYYLYSQDGYFTMIPWDYNMSIGGFGGLSTLGVSVDEPAYNIDMEDIPLANKLLAVPEYRERYEGYVMQLLEYVENIEERVATIQEVIEPYVEADPTKFYTMEEFYQSIEDTVLEEERAMEAIERMEDGREMTPPTGGMEDGREMTAPTGGMEDGREMTAPTGGMEDEREMTLPTGGMEDEREMTSPTGGEMNPSGEGRNKQGGAPSMGETDFSIIAYLKHRLETITQELNS